MSEYVYTSNGEPLMNESGEIYLARTERTCKPISVIRYDYEGSYVEYETELTCGHKWRDSYGDYPNETKLTCGHKWRDSYGDYPNYCPYCGARVILWS